MMKSKSYEYATSWTANAARLFATVVLLFSSVGSLHGQIPGIEREALIALYVNTNGPGWVYKPNWLGPPGTECTWWGVVCEDNRVKELLLRHNGLVGPLPSQIGSLERLETLSLYMNILKGEIPAELGNLKLIKNIYLSETSLKGEIPAELGDAVSLERLLLDSNNLTGAIPPDLGNLQNLQELDLFDNRLTGNIPSEIGTLRNLRVLRLFINELTGPIPKELCLLSALEEMWLDENQLSGEIPPCLGGMENLRFLGLNHNELSGFIPPELGALPHLERLLLHQNYLEGSIPAELGNLSALNLFYLHKNNISGEVPSELMNFTALWYGCANISFNALWTEDPVFREFLESNFRGWEQTQTIAPSNIRAMSTTDTSILVRWDPIVFVEEAGRFEIGPPPAVFSDDFESGDFIAWESPTPSLLPMEYSTQDKVTISIQIDGLDPGTEYQFAIRTITDPHENNVNQVVSNASETVTTRTSGSEQAKKYGFVTVSKEN